MSTNDSHPCRLTRRALAGAAWTAPVVVLVSAAPAFAAASPGTSLLLRPGMTAAIQTDDDTDSFYDLQFSGLSVVVPSALTAGELTLTVTYAPAAAGGPSTMVVYDDPGAPFVISPAVNERATAVVLTYAAAVAAGSEVQVPGGIFVAASEPASVQRGAYVVTAAAFGLSSDSRSFATPTTISNRTTVRRRL